MAVGDYAKIQGILRTSDIGMRTFSGPRAVTFSAFWAEFATNYADQPASFGGIGGYAVQHGCWEQFSAQNPGDATQVASTLGDNAFWWMFGGYFTGAPAFVNFGYMDLISSNQNHIDAIDAAFPTSVALGAAESIKYKSEVDVKSDGKNEVKMKHSFKNANYDWDSDYKVDRVPLGNGTGFAINTDGVPRGLGSSFCQNAPEVYMRSDNFLGGGSFRPATTDKGKIDMKLRANKVFYANPVAQSGLTVDLYSGLSDDPLTEGSKVPLEQSGCSIQGTGFFKQPA